MGDDLITSDTPYALALTVKLTILVRYVRTYNMYWELVWIGIR